jgi:hypothetical protein
LHQAHEKHQDRHHGEDGEKDLDQLEDNIPSDLSHQSDPILEARGPGSVMPLSSLFWKG